MSPETTNLTRSIKDLDRTLQRLVRLIQQANQIEIDKYKNTQVPIEMPDDDPV